MAQNKQPPVVDFRGGRRGLVMVSEKPKNTGEVLKRLVAYIGKSKYLFITLVLVMMAITVLNLAAPTSSGQGIDAITLADGRLEINFSRFVTMLVLLGATYLLNSLFSFCREFSLQSVTDNSTN